MENYWNYKQQLLVFTSWITRGLDKLEGYEKVCAEVFTVRNRRIELFQGRIRGTVIFNVDVGKVQTYCLQGGAVSQCTAVFEEDVKSILGKPVDRKVDTAPYFGFLVSKQKTIVFKTVDKENGDIKGAECANTSNLGNHEKRVKAIQAALRASGLPIVPLLLAEAKGTDKERKTRGDIVFKEQFVVAVPTFTMDTKDPIINTTDLSLKQVCPYMEFLLRYADRQGVGGVRWFLSVVDSARAGVKMT
jgi:hypothetical protein